MRWLIILAIAAVALVGTVTGGPHGARSSGSAAAGTCPLSRAGTTLSMTVAGCTTVASDTSSRADPLPFWGSVDCQSTSRLQQVGSGGDPHPTAAGPPQGDSAYRRLTVFDGDNYYGERCELGHNDIKTGPTVFYREGERRATYISVRLPDNLPLGRDSWQVLMQMKQTQPSANGGGTPILALEAWGGRWRLRQSNSPGPSGDAHELWSAPARVGQWTRFAFDITYSRDPSIGSIKVYADLNGDGDFSDPGEQSATIHTYTLKVETPGGPGPIAPGESIPAHLRAGIYHDPNYKCPAPTGCSSEIDNVQVLASPGGSGPAG